MAIIIKSHKDTLLIDSTIGINYNSGNVLQGETSGCGQTCDLPGRYRNGDNTDCDRVRPFTVEQAKQVFQSNPKNLSIEEMFRIARTYPAGSPEYNKIFMTAVLLNPEHPVANLNAACILAFLTLG